MNREQAINYLKSTGMRDEQIRTVVDAFTCEDVISRQAVLSKIKEVCFSEEWIQFRVDKGSNGQRDFLINYIKQLPSVTPQQKKGQWIDRNAFLLRYRCSECGWDLEKYNYCPNCGAKMEV